MAKRTHAEFLESGPPDRSVPDDERAVQTGLCAHRINHAKTVVRRAMKLAAGFERQKSGRRRKTAKQKKDDAALARFDMEALALKSLDLERAAEDHIHKSLLKIKSIASSEALPPSVKPPSRAVVDTASLNVLARLYNSNPVQTAMKTLITDIQGILGLEDRNVKVRKAKNKETTPTAERKPKPQRQSDTSDDEEYPEYKARIAASSDEDNSEASGSDADSGVVRLKSKVSPRIDVSISPPPSSEESSFEGFSEPEIKAGSSKPSKALIESTFVPSLTTGGYWSGSESEPEDDVDVQPRKNRRGQQARRKLAEKKFGEEAKHIKEAKTSDRDKGWDLKRGAQDGSRGRNGRYRSGDSRNTRNFASDANKVELNQPKPKKDDTGPLHPSWQAAKLAKEKKQTAAFQGKKVVFD
ncbi:Bud-site selection protein, partial [Mytilinidion resinicola]